MISNYKIGDYYSQNCIHVHRNCGVIKFTHANKRNAVFKFVDGKLPSSPKYTQKHVFKEYELASVNN